MDAVQAEVLGELPTVVDQVALARLYGEPLFSLPQDLYIPPDALEVFLEAFEGPLDLLLYLIRRQNFNILDIPMASLTRQYLSYIESIRQRNLELAADYLLMAAMLIEIKSRMLLPPRPAPAGQEPEDPRATLVRRLLEYGRIKQATSLLNTMALAGRDFWAVCVPGGHEPAPRLAEVSLDDLRQAWLAVVQRARLVQNHPIGRAQLSVREHMSLLLKRLQGRRFETFEALFDPGRGVAVLVVTFIALLELAKESLVDLTQAEAFAPIYVRLAQQPPV